MIAIGGSIGCERGILVGGLVGGDVLDGGGGDFG